MSAPQVAHGGQIDSALPQAAPICCSESTVNTADVNDGLKPAQKPESFCQPGAVTMVGHEDQPKESLRCNLCFNSGLATDYTLLQI
ncbi:hypothetical protein CgunFtcFv8_013831 [Champsocephalus gunnari]|nr:hypothetical protein CgunFtcFv8_013831 [Champsocephalus gunnari]